MKEKRKYADRAEYLKRAVAKRRKAMRVRTIEYKGGKCSRCGYERCLGALEFHHTDGGKDFGISRDGLTRSWDRIRREIEKCVLLCANCHREEHERLCSLSEKSESEERGELSRLSGSRSHFLVKSVTGNLRSCQRD